MKEIDFKISYIQIDESAIFEENFDENDTNIELTTDVILQINDDEQKIGLVMSIKINQNDKILAKIKTSNHFDIDEHSWQKMKSDHLIIIPKEFAQHLTTISVASIRGVLLAKTEHSKLSKIVLPLVDMHDMYSEDVITNLD